eukprot:403362480
MEDTQQFLQINQTQQTLQIQKAHSEQKRPRSKSKKKQRHLINTGKNFKSHDQHIIEKRNFQRLNNEDFELLIPEESEHDYCQSPTLPKFSQKVLLTELQPQQRKRFTIAGSRLNLVPLDMNKYVNFDTQDNNPLDSDLFMRTVNNPQSNNQGIGLQLQQLAGSSGGGAASASGGTDQGDFEKGGTAVKRRSRKYSNSFKQERPVLLLQNNQQFSEIDTLCQIVQNNQDKDPVKQLMHDSLIDPFEDIKNQNEHDLKHSSFTGEQLRLYSVLNASHKSLTLTKYKSQIYSITQLGSGIPLIDINEEQIEEEEFSSDQESQENQDELDDFFLDKNKMQSQHIVNKTDSLAQQQNSNSHKRQSQSDSYVTRAIDKKDLHNLGLDDDQLLEKIDSMCMLYNDGVAQNDDFFLIDRDDLLKEDSKDKEEGTPRFGDNSKYQNIKFLFRKEQQKQKFISEIDSTVILWQQLRNLKENGVSVKRSKVSKALMENPIQFDSQPMQTDTNFASEDYLSTTESRINRQTIVFCELHKLLVYIRKSQHSSQDLMIKTKSNGISVKFFISIRRGAIQALLKLKQKFDLVIYSSLDKEMGDAILDQLEQDIAGGSPLFDQRFHAQDCDILNSQKLNLSEQKHRSLDVIIQSQLQNASYQLQNQLKTGNFLRGGQSTTYYRSEKNVIFISQNYKDVAMHIQNTVPIKQYDGKRSKNSTLMNLVVYLYKRMLGQDDVKSIIENDFLKLSTMYDEIKPQFKMSKQKSMKF